MKKTARDNRPRIKPIESIEVDQKHLTLRAVLFVLFLVLGIAAIIYGLSGLFADPGGWRTVQAEAVAEADCSDEFVLQYEFGTGDLSAKTEYNQLAAIYGELTAKAYQLFHETQTFDGICNVAYLNEHPGEPVEVDPVLYDALSQMDASGGRQLFLAPIYEYYSQLFLCSQDFEIKSYDPTRNEDLAALFAEILAFAGDPEAISLELQGEGMVCLRISDAYRNFAAENEIYTFIGFQWMKNAFIADYLADTLIESGYNRGSLSSYDGFCRNLDDRGTAYSLNLFDRVGNLVYNPGTLNYTERISIVSLRSFPVSSSDNPHYYVLADGETRFPYLNPDDGLCLASTSNLVCYSQSAGCAEILLRMIPIYITDSFEPASLIGTEKIEAIYCRDGVIWHTAETVKIMNVDEESGYSVKKAG